jgi:aspartate/glutamate racemase
MHVGLIGGIGPAATIYYYREIVRLFAQAQTRLEMTIVNVDLRAMVDNLVANNTQAQAAIFSHYTAQLKAGGWDFVALASMGGHFCITDFEPLSPLPVLDAIAVMNREFVRQNLRTRRHPRHQRRDELGPLRRLGHTRGRTGSARTPTRPRYLYRHGGSGCCDK